MGQQQILLIVLSVILVGVAVAIGISMFRDNAISASKDAIISDLNDLAARCYKYRISSSIIGGGSGSYSGLDEADLGSLNNANAQYVLTAVAADEVTITATGKQGSTPWIITCVVDHMGNPSFTDTQEGKP